MDLGPVVAMGFMFGGLAQLIAGFLEQKTGNNFGFAAFTTYGAFWIGLGVIWILNYFKSIYFIYNRCWFLLNSFYAFNTNFSCSISIYT